MKCPKCGVEMEPTNNSEILGIYTWYVCPKCGTHYHIFEEVLSEYRQKIWSEIAKYFYTKIRGISDVENEELEKFHWDMVTEYPKRKGKYMRPTLLVLTAEAMGVSLKKSIKTAAAMQTSEDWILIHDDWEDGSMKRRGESTLHIQYTPELAINAGDSLHLIMWRMLRDNFNILNKKISLRIIDEFLAMLERTTLGQTAEILWTQQHRYDLTENDVYYIIDGKTSYYSVAGPMRLGAILADSSEDVLDIISEFGTYLGRAYQIRDDLLDLETTFRGLKERGNDIKEGKRSLMLVHLLNHANEKDMFEILNVLEKKKEKITKNDINKIIYYMNRYGSIEYAKGEADKWAKKALHILDTKMDFLKEEKAKERIRWAIDFILTRDF